mmetsp:Transcript_33732/g.54307  ORF Transcript_33732/g.54307 Transcript_33732/m.54307 type:complete len:402 (+) Transcript_33732:153-1358(+)
MEINFALSFEMYSKDSKREIRMRASPATFVASSTSSSSSSSRPNNYEKTRSRRSGRRRTCVVTGGTKGLGKAIAQKMLENGYTVVIAARDEERGEKCMRDIGGEKEDSIICRKIDESNRNIVDLHEQRLYFHKLDLEDHSTIVRFVDWCNDRVGPIDVLFNNAAVCLYSNSLEAAIKSLEINTFGLYTLTKALILQQKPRQQLNPTETDDEDYNNDGYIGKSRMMTPPIIINLSSSEGELHYLNSDLAARLEKISMGSDIALLQDMLGEVLDTFDPDFEYAFGESPFYSVSKAAVNAITRILSNSDKNANRYIINSVCPGDVATDMITAGQEYQAKSPEDAAEDVLWLALSPPCINNDERDNITNTSGIGDATTRMDIKSNVRRRVWVTGQFWRYKQLAQF